MPFTARLRPGHQLVTLGRVRSRFKPNARLLVRLSYLLGDSQRYQRVKQTAWRLLEDPDSRTRPFFDVFMIVLVLASVSLLVYQTYGETGQWANWFEVAVVVAFICEYLARFWVCCDSHRIIIEHFERAEFINVAFQPGPALVEILGRKWAYVRSPLAIIDLLAIIPTYRPVRMLRLFVLFRLFKLFRYARSLSGFSRVLVEKRFELMALSVFLAFLVFGAGSALVIFEVENPDSEINSFFDGIYWAMVTVSTLGYGDIVPATPEGRLVAMLLIVAGLGTFSFLASIIVSAFSEHLPELRLQQVSGELERGGGHTIICGYGRVGQEVASALSNDGTRLAIIDSDEEHYRQARQEGYLAVHGHAEQEQMLETLHVDSAKRILCLTGDDVINVYITVSARYHNADIEIISRANQQENVTKLKQAGADRTVAPFETAGYLAAQYLGQPLAFDAISEVLTVGEGVGIDAIRVSSDSHLADRPIGTLNLPDYKLILFGVVSARGGESSHAPHAYTLGEQQFFFNPRPEFVLEHNDLIMVFGHDLSVSHFKEWVAEQVGRS